MPGLGGTIWPVYPKSNKYAKNYTYYRYYKTGPPLTITASSPLELTKKRRPEGLLIIFNTDGITPVLETDGKFSAFLRVFLAGWFAHTIA